MSQKWIGAGTLVLFAGSFAFGQVPQPQPGIATIQAHARAVLLDVVVRDKNGHPVHGLKATDFAVTEDGMAQRIASFDEVLPPAANAMATAMEKLPLNTFSNQNKIQPTGTATVLLLDGLDTAPEWQMYARDQLVKWVNSATLTGPTAIFSLDTTLHQIQGFTTDIEVLRAAVKERTNIMLTPIPRTPGYVATQTRFGGLTGALQGLGAYLATFPGRKNLIWFTGSVPVRSYEGGGSSIGSSLIDPESFSFDFSSTSDMLRMGRISVYPIDSEGLRTDPAFDASRSKAPTGGQIMAFGVRQGERHEDLDDVAQATGGKAFYDTNDIKGAIAEIQESGADYYTLTYYPSNKNWDGKYRKLKVELDQEGDHLEYRRGYYAIVSTGIARNQREASTAANTVNMRRQITTHAPEGFWQSMHLGAIDPGSIVFRVHAAPETAVIKPEKNQPLPKDNYLEPKFRDKPFHQYDVDYSVDGKQLQISASADGLLQGQLEFGLLVLDDKGLLVNSFKAMVNMNLKPETYQYILKNGLAYQTQIAVPAKGNFFIRAGVHDVPSGKSGALEVNVGEIRPETKQ